VRALDLSTGATSKLDCGGITPGTEWQAAAERSLTFRRCLANRVETADLSASSKKGLPSNEKPVVSALSNSGARLVVVTGAGSIMLLDRPSGLRKMRRLADLGRGKQTRMVRPSLLSISPNGRLVAFYNGGTTSEVFNLDDLLADLPPTAIRTANVGIVDRLAFSNNGEWLATIRSDGAISLWDATGLIEVGTLKGSPAGWHDLVFSPSGALLGEFGSGGIMTLWDMAPQSWKQKACTLSGRTLSQLERARYLPGGEFSFPINPCVSIGGKL
jgi:WD40 repeat protein